MKIGEKLKVCPFFVSKDQVENADIVFMPYNYLLDPKVRSSNNVSRINCFIDAGHTNSIKQMHPIRIFSSVPAIEIIKPIK